MTVKCIETISALRAETSRARSAGKSIGFVPTMGALHAGHLSLVEAAKAENVVVVVSIFVNPTQFGPGEDFDKYPRDLVADLETLAPLDVDYVFAPSRQEMYPDPPEVTVWAPTLAARYCGASRPGHFDGVGLVVSKLLNIVAPDRAYFGQKDYQQAAIIRMIVRQLNFPINIVVCPIIREADGLAMSSRNLFLGPSERQQALALNETLRETKAAATKGFKVGEKQTEVEKKFALLPDARLDYFAVANPDTLEPLETVTPGQRAVALIAAYVGKTRLIDNMLLG